MSMRIETLDIESIQFTRHSSVVEWEIPKIPPRARIKGRIYTARHTSFSGSKTRLTLTQYLEKLLIRNELEAVRKKPLTRPQLEHNIFTEFSHFRLNRLKTHRKTMGSYQNAYNKGDLYASQPPPILVSFRYDDEGYIVDSSRPDVYLTFDECKRTCVKYQIADPRFFTFKELTEIRKAIASQEEPWVYWKVPTHEETIKLTKTLQTKALYAALRFPEGLGIQETVADL